MSGRHGFRRVLVANRGKIAARVIRTCRRLGIETVLTVSDADAGSVPARLADTVVRIGAPPAAASYLDVDAVVAAAVAAGADAVHPGYGFLSENARLARACAAAGVVFIGPAPETLEASGDKLAAREHAAAAGLPVLPGGRIGPVGHRANLSGPVGHRATTGVRGTEHADGGGTAGATEVFGAAADEARWADEGRWAAEAVELAEWIGFPVLAKEVETQTGQCAAHGTVEATREIPKMGFPFVVYAVWRALARRQPFLCPECGSAVHAD